MNFIYLEKSGVLLNLDFVTTATKNIDGGTYVSFSGTALELKEDLNYVKELVYEAQHGKEEKSCDEVCSEATKRLGW